MTARRVKSSKELVGWLKTAVATPDDPFQFAIVQQITPDVRVAFEGDIDNTGAPIMTDVAIAHLDGYHPSINDRVLMGQINGKWLIVDSIGEDIDWTAIPLGTNVTYSDTGEYRPAYQFDASSGRVNLRGIIRPTSTLSTAENVGTLPAVISPLKICILVHSIGAGTGAVGRLDVNTNGVLSERSNPGLTTAQYISLEGLSYSISADI